MRRGRLATEAAIIFGIVSPRLGVFAYGSLVSVTSAQRTLGRPVADGCPTQLAGWRRRWSTARDNLRCEKTFARSDGTRPPYCLGLNVEPDAGGSGPNGMLFEVTDEELARLAIREVRYDRVEVTDELGARGRFDHVFTFTAKPEHLAPSPPTGAVILAAYVLAVEAAFESLGPRQLDAFRRSTGAYPVEVVEATLVRDRIPAGNPREW